MLGLVLTLGAVAGFGVSVAVAEHPTAEGAPAPVAARSPSLPVDPVPELLPPALPRAKRSKSRLSSPGASPGPSSSTASQAWPPSWPQSTPTRDGE